MYFTVQYSIEYSSTILYFKLRMSESKDKNISDIPGIAKKHQLVYWTSVLFKILYCKIKIFFIFCICFLCTMCVKSIINLLQYSTIYITGCISWVPRLICWRKLKVFSVVPNSSQPHEL